MLTSVKTVRFASAQRPQKEKKGLQPLTFSLGQPRKPNLGLSLAPRATKHGLVRVKPKSSPKLRFKLLHTVQKHGVLKLNSGWLTPHPTPACGCSPSGFKKLLNHKVFKKRHSEVAHYNRHKHHISHNLVNTSHRQRLSKTFAYLSLNKIKFCVAMSLQLAYGVVHDPDLHYVQPGVQTRGFKSWVGPKLIKSCVYFMGDNMESVVEPNLSRNQFSLGLRHARQKLNHNLKPRQPLGLACTFGADDASSTKYALSSGQRSCVAKPGSDLLITIGTCLSTHLAPCATVQPSQWQLKPGQAVSCVAIS